MDSQNISLLGQQIPVALVLVFLQNWLKQQSWFPLIDYETTRANHLFAIVASGLATIGIHFTWSAESHSLIISGLSWASLLGIAWHWIQQYIVSKASYVALQSQLNPPKAQQVQAVTQIPKKDIPT